MPAPADHEDLSAYLDGELTDAEVAELEAELARDPELRAELADLHGVVHFLRREGPTHAPMGFHRSVMDRIEAEHPAGRVDWSWLRRPFGIPLEGWLVAAAAAAVLLFAIPKAGPSGGELGVYPAPPEQSPAASKTRPEMPPEAGTAAESDVPPAEKRKEAAPTRKQKQLPAAEKVAVPPASGTAEADDPEVLATEAIEPGTAAEQVRYPAGYAFTIEVGDAAAKRQILAVASRYGVPLDALGTAEPSAKLDGARETIVVEMATARLPMLHAELERLGYPLTGISDDGLIGTTNKTMLVRIQLERAADE